MTETLHKRNVDSNKHVKHEISNIFNKLRMFQHLHLKMFNKFIILPAVFTAGSPYLWSLPFQPFLSTITSATTKPPWIILSYDIINQIRSTPCDIVCMCIKKIIPNWLAKCCPSTISLTNVLLSLLIGGLQKRDGFQTINLNHQWIFAWLSSP